MAGVSLQQTPVIAALLEKNCDNVQLPEDLDLQRWVGKEVVPWALLKRLCFELRAGSGSSSAIGGEGPWLHQAAKGARLVFEAPPQRVRSPELEARLQILQRNLDQRNYDAMVQDVTSAERKAREASQTNYGTYKQQLSFGVHVTVMMGTLYAVGHMAGGALHPDPIFKVVGGLVGLIAAMLLEATLLILRTGFESDKASPATKQQQPHRQQQQQAGSEQSQEAGQKTSSAQQQLRPSLPYESTTGQPAPAGREGLPAAKELVHRRQKTFVQDSRGNIVNNGPSVASLERTKVT